MHNECHNKVADVPTTARILLTDRLMVKVYYVFMATHNQLTMSRTLLRLPTPELSHHCFLSFSPVKAVVKVLVKPAVKPCT